MLNVREFAASYLRRCSAGLTIALFPVFLSLGGCETVPPAKPQPMEVAPVAPPVPAPVVNTAQLAEEAELREMVALQDRLYRVAAPILVNNPTLCRHYARNLLGFTAKNKYSYSNEFVESAQKILGLDEQLQIMGVMQGSGAANAGVLSGDKLIAVNNIPLPQGQNAEYQAGVLLAPEVSEHMSIKLTINRGGTDMSLDVPLTHACAFIVVLGNTDNVNAYADGFRVMVTRGMMNVAKSDEELAYVLATEMAHNVLGHATKRHMGANIAGVIDNLARIHPDMGKLGELSAIKPSPQELNVAADKLGLYMVARAGFAVDNAEPFWARLAAEYPPTVVDSYSALHPATVSRLAIVVKITNEIKSKQAAKKALLP
jgi:hypothetical protein